MVIENSDYEHFKNTVCGQLESTEFFQLQTTNQGRYEAYEAVSISILDAAKTVDEEAFLYESLDTLLDEKAKLYGVTREDEQSI
jgi:hypothetical protein